ncbi:hypothetical protein [Actinoplanes philippinensis]|uniref:hypothetical protein n=1 Tax=Actinoplanes philippinensis TaxID=35752 RepID=UPI00340712D5
MRVLIYDVVTAALLLLVVRAGARLGPRGRFPVVAAVLTGLILGGLALQAAWPGAMAALDNDPSAHGWWRPFTSVLMQNGGFVGNLWNVVTIAVVAALAEWHWGRLGATALFLAGAVVPYAVGSVLGGTDVSTDPRNWAGSSGATYLLGATLAGALLIRAASVRDRLLAAAAPAAGLAAWFVQDNAHGLVVVYGAALGLLITGLQHMRKPSDRPHRTASA